MSPRNRTGFQRIVLAAFVVTIACVSAARADDMLDRGVRFHIAASPLANALLEFSSQSGIKVAAADADVSQLSSNGVNGTLPAHAALSMLLHGTGLVFSRVGAETVAIRTASVGPAIGAVTRASGSGATAGTPAQPDPNANASASPGIPDVTVMSPRPPADQELAGDSLHQFVVHHATVHYFNIGRQSICPLTVGLDPAYNAFVTARVRALAVNVGAPVQSDLQCKDNVRIVFTADPQKVMTNVVKWASVFFRPRGRYAQMRPLIQFTSDHAIQGWYITTAGGGTALNFDFGLLPLNLQPLWPTIGPDSLTDYGDMSGIGVVILVVDTTKVAGYAIGTIADYVAVLTLSVSQSPDHCDPLPSILDVLASSCGTREKPTAVTAGDLAFLKALYYRNTGQGSTPTRDEIQYYMLRQFKSLAGAQR
jgi:hypothetical protein